MIIFTESERRFLFSLINDQYQNWNFRSIEGPLLESLLNKLRGVSVGFTRTESSKIQCLIKDTSDLYSRLADPRLQFILQGQSGPQSGVGGTAVIGAVGGSSGGASSFFDAPATYNICTEILRKLANEVTG